MKHYLRSGCQVLCGLLLLLVSFTSLSDENKFTVNSMSDIGDYDPGDGICSIRRPLVIPRRCTLRAAIQEANELEDPYVIILGSGRYTLAIAGAGEDAALTGDLDITDRLTIRGEGAAATFIDGAGLDRVFHIRGNIVVTLDKLTVTGGEALDDPVFPGGMGGGVLVENRAFLRVEHSRIAGNKAVLGGGIGGSNAREIEILYSEITRNLVQSKVTLNLAQKDSVYASNGGALYVYPDRAGDTTNIDISWSTISHNSCSVMTDANCLGGISLEGCGDVPGGLLMSNSTVSTNKGAGLSMLNCNGTIENSTIYSNTGYGIDYYSGSGSPGQFVTARNTIFAHNGIKDCNLVLGSWDFEYGHNLSSDDTCDLNPQVMDKINTDPKLYPLGTYEPIAPAIALTHHPRWGAPVIDNGEDLLSITDDQEGFPRPLDGNQNDIDSHDMGAMRLSSSF
ncbi:MAG: right-handed parallel beta-helix repeat-containing protein [Deltaproteobacteria bacterium]|nr:right-handed parallel beta-helix repeat-containing protein [Deltaproteobacteria bacterium]